MKTKRIAKHIMDYIIKVPMADFYEILEYINRRSKHGTTKEALGSILNRLKNEKKIIKIASFSSSDNKCSIWKNMEVKI